MDSILMISTILSSKKYIQLIITSTLIARRERGFLIKNLAYYASVTILSFKSSNTKLRPSKFFFNKLRIFVQNHIFA